MPLDETRTRFSEEERGKIIDPNPARRRHVTELLLKFASRKISPADLIGVPRKRLSRLAEIGYLKYKYGRYQEALQVFETLATLDNRVVYFHTALGGVYQKLQRYVDAVVEYTKSIRLNPKSICPHVNRGEIYLRHKNFRRAAEDFRSAILLDNQGKDLWANRARSLVIALKRNLELKRKSHIPPP